MKHKYGLWLVLGGLAINWIDDFTATKGVAYSGVIYGANGILKSFVPGSNGWGLPEDFGVVAATAGAAILVMAKE